MRLSFRGVLATCWLAMGNYSTMVLGNAFSSAVRSFAKQSLSRQGVARKCHITLHKKRVSQSQIEVRRRARPRVFTMALLVYGLVILGSFLTVSADVNDCMGYSDDDYKYHQSQTCFYNLFCCGSCDNRFCCSDRSERLSAEDQDECNLNGEHVRPVLVSGIISSIVIISIIILSCCCVCPCCCLYKLCRKPRPVVATTTHTTVVTTPYPQNTTPAQQYPGYQPVAPQPGYGTPAGYGAQSMPSAPYQGQPYAVGPPPPYQESVGPGYPVNYTQAAFMPGQQSYPLQPPVPASYQAQPPPPADINAIQPAYNPDYVAQPSKPAY